MHHQNVWNTFVNHWSSSSKKYVQACWHIKKKKKMKIDCFCASISHSQMLIAEANDCRSVTNNVLFVHCIWIVRCSKNLDFTSVIVFIRLNLSDYTVFVEICLLMYEKEGEMGNQTKTKCNREKLFFFKMVGGLNTHLQNVFTSNKYLQIKLKTFYTLS